MVNECGTVITGLVGGGAMKLRTSTLYVYKTECCHTWVVDFVCKCGNVSRQRILEHLWEFGYYGNGNDDVLMDEEVECARCGAKGFVDVLISYDDEEDRWLFDVELEVD